MPAPETYDALLWPPAGLRILEVDSVAKCGVYFLMQRGAVAYVGSSISINARVGLHVKNKEFDQVTWIEMAADKLYEAERNWILMLKPIYNGYVDKYGIRRYCAPGRDQMPLPTMRQRVGCRP
jgi:hypothetical protein